MVFQPVLALLLPLLISVVPVGSPESDALLIQGVRIVDVKYGKVSEEQDVLVAAQKIVAVGVGLQHEGAQTIAGNGQFLIPGLIDSHVHLSTDLDGFAAGLVAHGVTLVRDTGAATAVIMEVKRDIEEGQRFGPSMIVTGAIVDGSPPVWPFSEACATPEQARAAVRRLHEAGVDQIKVYSLLEPEVYAAAVDQAHDLGLQAIGHVPNKLTIRDALQHGQDGVEHYSGFETLFAELVPDPVQVDGKNISANLVHWLQFDNVDSERLDEFLFECSDAGMVLCPTMVVMQGIGRMADENRKSDPRLQQISPQVQAFWNGGRYSAFAPLAAKIWPEQIKLTRAAYEAGVKLIVGTDLANPMVFPGSSLHDEMDNFLAAGLSPLEVLQATTIRPAEFFGVADQYGSVEPGKVASLVLLKRNPLEDLKAVREIAAVFLRGEYFDRSRLDQLLDASTDEDAVETSTPSEVPALPGTLMAEGRFQLKFGAFDSGYETFRLTRSDAGFHWLSESHPRGGFQQPFRLVAHLSPEHEFVSAEWTQLTDPPLTAVYTRDGDVIRAVAQQESEKFPPQKVPFGADNILSMPVNLSDFGVLRELDLEVGESKEVMALGFGYSGWQIVETKTLYRRLEDQSFASPKGTVNAAVYESEFESPMGEFHVVTQVGPDGIPLQMKMDFAMGTLTAERVDTAD